MTYDRESFALAEHFLQDVAGLSDADRRLYADRIAKSVQRVVEDELEAIESERSAATEGEKAAKPAKK